MVPVPLLPSCGCDADILFLGLARGRHLGLVDRALVQAPAPLHDAAGLLFSPAVAVLLLEVDGDGVTLVLWPAEILAKLGSVL